MKDILKTATGVLLAAIIILGCWIGIEAWETHHNCHLLSNIINCPPCVVPKNETAIDSLGRVALSIGSSHDYEYVVVKITLKYDTYIHHPIGKGETYHSNFYYTYISVENVTEGNETFVYYQLTQEQLEHITNVYYRIERYKLR